MRIRRGWFLTVVAVAGVVLPACGSQSFTNAKGSEAQRIAGVWWLMFGLAAAVYVIVASFIIVGALRGRGTERGRPSRLSDDGLIWVGGIIVPTLILLVLAVVTVHASTHLREPETNALHIDVVGKQWWWQVIYPDTGFETANEIRVPVGRQVDIRLDSDNVIHSFWVPQLAGKLDTVPGQRNSLRFTVKEPGTYVGHCAEYCGLQHANMGFSVIALPAAEFDRWMVSHARSPAGPTSDIEEQGQLAFMSLPCAGCHTINGTAANGTRGPNLTDFGARATIAGMPVGNTKGNLAGWIVNAQSLKQGSMMPPIAVPPNQLLALVAYLESLK